jgi:hypothetical protein
LCNLHSLETWRRIGGKTEELCDGHDLCCESIKTL